MLDYLTSRNRFAGFLILWACIFVMAAGWAWGGWLLVGGPHGMFLSIPFMLVLRLFIAIWER